MLLRVRSEKYNDKLVLKYHLLRLYEKETKHDNQMILKRLAKYSKLDLNKRG